VTRARPGRGSTVPEADTGAVRRGDLRPWSTRGDPVTITNVPSPEALRIALVAPPWLPVPPEGYGGTERVVALLADGLVAAGHDVVLFAAPGSRSRAEVVTPLAARPSHIGSAWGDEVFHVLTAMQHRDDFDVVHDHTGLGPALAAMSDDGPPVVHTLHGAWTPDNRRLFERIHDRVALVAISDAQRRENPHVGYAATVHNGIDVHAHPMGTHKDDYLVFVGRVNPDKGPEVAVEVAHRSGLPLVMIVKRGEPEEQAYWDEVVAPRLRGDELVLEQPPHTVKASLVARARAALCPIDWPEPFGLVLAEALACGTPVITRPLGAAPEIVLDGVTGFLCDTVDDMVASVGRARRIRPEACRDAVEARFSGAAMVAGYLAVYRAAVAARTGGAALVGAERLDLVGGVAAG